jgi:antirestriction protein
MRHGFKIGQRVKCLKTSDFYRQCGETDGTIVDWVKGHPEWACVQWDNEHINNYRMSGPDQDIDSLEPSND